MMLACMAGYAQDSATLLDRIRQENTRITSIACDFKQTTHLDFMDEDVLSHGKFYYRKPGHLLMKYEDPAGERMLISGENISMVAAGQHKKVSAKSSPEIGLIHSVFSSCLEGDPRKIKGASVTATESAARYEVTIDIQGGATASIQCVRVHYDKKSLALTMLRTEDPDGGYTVYALTAQKLNEGIGDDVFK